MQLEILRPWGLVALAVLPVLVYYSYRGLVRQPWWRRASALVARVGLVLLATAVLCGVRQVEHSGECFVAYAIDTSRSVSDASLAAAYRFIREAEGRAARNTAVAVRFDRLPDRLGKATTLGDGLPARPPLANSGGKPYAQLLGGERTDWRFDELATDIALGITAARATIPTDYVPRLVLFSDGRNTAGDEAVKAAARAAGVPVWTVPLPSPRPEIHVVSVTAPPRVRPGEPFDIEAVVAASDGGAARVRLVRGDTPATAPAVATQTDAAHSAAAQTVAERTVALAAGENSIRFEKQVLEKSGEVAYYVAVEPSATDSEGFQDTIAENNLGGTVVFVGVRRRALVVEGRPGNGARLAAPLANLNLEVSRLSPDSLPLRKSELAVHDLVVLVNVPAAALGEGRIQALGEYLREGGGLLLIGGDRTFTPGGYRNSALEELLPLRADVKDKPKPEVALVLIIDASESMEEGGAIAMARTAAQRAVERLAPWDLVGVLVFADDTQWITQLRACGDKKAILQELEKITALGRTNMYPALETAYLALRESFAPTKHILLLSDGLSDPGDFKRLSQEIAESGITVSTIALGPEAAQPLLRNIAQTTKGKFYHCPVPADLPRVFALEAGAFAKDGITEEAIVPQPLGTIEAWSEIDFAKAPSLLGYLETQAKPGARVLLAAGRDEPLLAEWRVGRGTSIAFASDIESRWAPLWLRWDEFDKFWALVARRALRETPPPPFDLRVAWHKDMVHVLLAPTEGGQGARGAEATLQVIAPDKTSFHLALRPLEGQGFAGEFAVNRPGIYYLDAVVANAGSTSCALRRGLVVCYPDELRPQPTNTDLLREIAELTAGRYDPKPADIHAPDGRSVIRTTPWWPYFLMAFVVLLVVDVAVRRGG